MSALSPIYQCDATKKTVDHIILTCPIHRKPTGTKGLTVLNKLQSPKTGSATSTSASDVGHSGVLKD